MERPEACFGQFGGDLITGLKNSVNAQGKVWMCLTDARYTIVQQRQLIGQHVAAVRDRTLSVQLRQCVGNAPGDLHTVGAT